MNAQSGDGDVPRGLQDTPAAESMSPLRAQPNFRGLNSGPTLLTGGAQTGANFYVRRECRPINTAHRNKKRGQMPYPRRV